MKRVLSIQSHVVFGNVGNKAATFPLQLLGYEVDPLNTVMFSNHTGYPKFKGIRLSSKQILDTFDGLKQNKLINYSHILVGYLGYSDLVKAVRSIVMEIKERNPKAVLVLDPVMGDDGKLYVSSDIVPLYKELLCPLADVMTPNQTELEYLTDVKIQNIESLKTSFNILHSMNVKNIVLTSGTLSLDDTKLFLYASSNNQLFSIEYTKKQGEFSGTGDLFSALLLARFNNEDLKSTCLYALASIQGVLDSTIKGNSISDLKNDESGYEEAKVELKLIDSKESILNPNLNLGFLIKDL